MNTFMTLLELKLYTLWVLSSQLLLSTVGMKLTVLSSATQKLQLVSRGPFKCLEHVGESGLQTGHAMRVQMCFMFHY